MKLLAQRSLTREIALHLLVKLLLVATLKLVFFSEAEKPASDVIPMPRVATEGGWLVAEYGRQPWSIFGVLPIHLSASRLSVGNLYVSLAGFIGFYTLLLVAELYLMIKFARLGPGSLGTGRYHHEQEALA